MTAKSAARRKRTIFSKILSSLAPLLAPLYLWQGALAAYDQLGCRAIGKQQLPCLWLGHDWGTLLGGTAWWAMLLCLPGLVVSVILLTRNYEFWTT